MENEYKLSDNEQAVGDKPSPFEHLDVDYNKKLHCKCNLPVSKGHISILSPDWDAFCRCYISHIQMRMEIRAGRVD